MTRHYLETLANCGHRQLWSSPPRIGETFYCTRCENTARVVQVPGSWRAKCDNCAFNCTRFRKETIGKNVRLHITQFPDHAVTVSDFNGNSYRVYDSSSATVRLLGAQVPPCGEQESMF